MSIFKKIGKAVKKAGKFVGNVASQAAPLVAMVPGVGTVAGAALGAGGAALAGKNLKTILTRGALGAAGGLAGGAVRGLIGGAGRGLVGKLAGSAATKLGGNVARKLTGGGALPPAPDMSGIPGSPLPGAGLAEGMANTMGNSPAISGGYSPNFASGDVASAAGTGAGTGGRSLLGRLGGALGSAGSAVGKYALQHPATVLQGGLAALGTLQGAGQQGEADAARRQALNLGLGETEVDLGDQYIDAGNAYARKRPMGPALQSARRALSGY
jgi:hypothetical protein